MSIKFSDIGKQTKKLPIDLEGDVINVEYLRNFQGSDRNSAIEEEARKPEHKYGYQVALLALIVTAWDINGDDGKPVPINDETVHGLGLRIQNHIMAEIQSDTLPKQMRLNS